ncbi:MAG: GTP cyclohydrolase I FolE [Desulfobacteraceae bacterium]|nr:GTP cyclohydrolase I FolE [Desulfobacteraceae bacterium]
MNKKILTNAHITVAANEVAVLLTKHIPNLVERKCYPIPRGGVPAAYAVSRWAHFIMVDTPEEADFFIDDLIDSGRTMERYCDEYPERPFYALFDKSGLPDEEREWLVFPWEQTEEKSIEDSVVRLLQYIGEDVGRGGLAETPKRVAKAWSEWTSGYGKDPKQILKCFEDGAEKCNEMVIIKDIPFFSHCEHHMAPFFGTATIAYVPNGKIVGLSKISRLLDIFAKRLQVQERLTNEIADAIDTELKATGVGVIIKARHLCMESRGIAKQGHHTITSALRGALLDKPAARAEFMLLAK